MGRAPGSVITDKWHRPGKRLRVSSLFIRSPIPTPGQAPEGGRAGAVHRGELPSEEVSPTGTHVEGRNSCLWTLGKAAPGPGVQETGAPGSFLGSGYLEARSWA